MLGGLAWLLPAHAGGVITLETSRRDRFKASPPACSAVVEAGAAPVRLPVDSAEPVGVTVQVWWIDAPRELCRIFAPWTGRWSSTGEQGDQLPLAAIAPSSGRPIVTRSSDRAGRRVLACGVGLLVFELVEFFVGEESGAGEKRTPSGIPARIPRRAAGDDVDDDLRVGEYSYCKAHNPEGAAGNGADADVLAADLESPSGKHIGELPSQQPPDWWNINGPAPRSRSITAAASGVPPPARPPLPLPHPRQAQAGRIALDPAPLHLLIRSPSSDPGPDPVLRPPIRRNQRVRCS